MTLKDTTLLLMLLGLKLQVWSFERKASIAQICIFTQKKALSALEGRMIHAIRIRESKVSICWLMINDLQAKLDAKS